MVSYEEEIVIPVAGGLRCRSGLCPVAGRCVGRGELQLVFHREALPDGFPLRGPLGPHGGLIGTRTWGGLSALTTSQESYSTNYAGVVGVMNSTPFYGYIPRWVNIFPGEGILEGVGITPDIELDLDIDRLLNEHRDNQLERAVDYILNGR